MARARDGLEIHLATSEFHQHEGVVRIISFGGNCALIQITGTQFSRSAFREVVNPVLRFDALVDVIMALKYDVHMILNEQRLQHVPQIGARTMRFSR